MKAYTQNYWLIATIGALTLSAANRIQADGIPEPGLILYGRIQNIATGDRLTFGTLRWTIQPAGGSPIILTTAITNINDQFSYILRVPFETALPGFSISANTLALSSASVDYTRSATINLVPATLALPTFSFGVADRGRLERVDLQVSIQFIDTDKNGLDDNWEMINFGHLGIDPNADPDHDGMNNLAEFKAGTNPNDAQSRFSFIDVTPVVSGGIDISWSSVISHKYTVQRSGNLLNGFTDLQPNINSTAGTTSFRDSTAIGAGPYFYRIRAD